MNIIKQLHARVVLTHMIKEDVVKIERRWHGQVFSACYIKQARGVMILIHKSVLFQFQDIIKDPAGRYVIIKGMLLTERIHLVNIYSIWS